MATALPFELLVAIFTEACWELSAHQNPENQCNLLDKYISTAHPDVSVPTTHIALSMYSVVHSTWSSPAQHLLFGHTIIESPERWGLFLRRLPLSPHLCAFVHTLELWIHITIDRSLVRILPRLLPSLQRVVFDVDVKPSISLLHILPTIKGIYTRAPQRSNQPFLSDEVYNTDTQLALQQLTIDNLSTQNCLLMWLRHTRTRERGTLRTLKLFAWTHQSSMLDSAKVVRRAYNPSLQVISPALDLGSKSVRKILEENRGIHHLTLTLNIDVEWSDELEPPALDLGTCSARTLVLVIPFNPSRRSCPWVFATLCDTTFPQLRRLELHFEEDKQECPWHLSPLWLSSHGHDRIDEQARKKAQWKLDSRGMDLSEMESPNGVTRMRSYIIPPALVNGLERVMIRCNKEHHETTTIRTMLRLLGEACIRGAVDVI